MRFTKELEEFYISRVDIETLQLLRSTLAPTEKVAILQRSALHQGKHILILKQALRQYQSDSKRVEQITRLIAIREKAIGRFREASKEIEKSMNRKEESIAYSISRRTGV